MIKTFAPFVEKQIYRNNTFVVKLFNLRIIVINVAPLVLLYLKTKEYICLKTKDDAAKHFLYSYLD